MKHTTLYFEIRRHTIWQNTIQHLELTIYRHFHGEEGHNVTSPSTIFMVTAVRTWLSRDASEFTVRHELNF